MPPSIEPALGCPQAELVDALILAFADYVGRRLHLDETSFGAFLAQQGVDLALSHAAVVDGSVRALALVAPRLPAGADLAVAHGASRARRHCTGALTAPRGRTILPPWHGGHPWTRWIAHS
ncbi:MAG: hypothetical protein P8Y13_12165 [Deinococcales bacterium]